MVKTSDFESENSDSSPGEAAGVLAALEALLEKAVLITGGPPFNMSAASEEFVKLSISGETATLSWPEMQSGYYNNSYLETQHCSFPAWMLGRPMDELKAWKADETKKAADKERTDRLAYQKRQEALQRDMELRALAVLKARYEGV